MPKGVILSGIDSPNGPMIFFACDLLCSKHTHNCDRQSIIYNYRAELASNTQSKMFHSIYKGAV